MYATEIIQKKRDGQENSAEEIQFLIGGGLSREVPPYQLSAWLMAVFFQGLNAAETEALSRTLIQSGRVLDFSDLKGPVVDKHSTGGVGDKTSLVVAPLAAAAGVFVPMISGRGLGHTGGTLDKLESIPGFRTNLSLPEFRQTVSNCGLALIGQTDELAPADRMLYALRDVTATVESIPLIVASIISKKAAEGLDGLVLDVKTGSGAFMKSANEALHLAQALVGLARSLGIRTTALITDMSQPLGLKVGNALEVQECVETLKGGGPTDLRELCLELAAHMIALARREEDFEVARAAALQHLESGRAAEKFQELIAAQGGDPRIVDRPQLLETAKKVFEFKAVQDGYVSALRADFLGIAAMRLGAGRERVDSEINPAVGLELVKKVGDRVLQGEVLLKFHYDDEDKLQGALTMAGRACQIADTRPRPPALIQKVLN